MPGASFVGKVADDLALECGCVSPSVSGSLFIAGGHPPPQWRMANEEASGEGCKRTCETFVHAVTPLFLVCFHGGSSHDIP